MPGVLGIPPRIVRIMRWFPVVGVSAVWLMDDLHICPGGDGRSHFFSYGAVLVFFLRDRDEGADLRVGQQVLVGAMYQP